jgi:transcriptional regulator with XRE-family HTH domain
MSSQLQLKPLEPKELAEYGIARVKDIAFEAVLELWSIRESEGLTQKMLADRIGCDDTSISRSFRGPANWTFKTFGRLVQGLRGSVRIIIDPLEEPVPGGSNFDAYDELDWDASQIKTPKLVDIARSANPEFKIVPANG